MRKAALAVVRQDDKRVLGEQLPVAVEMRGENFACRGLFKVSADNLLAPPDDPQFDGGRQPRIDRDVRFEASFGGESENRRTRGVTSDDSEQSGSPARGDDVAGHVPRAAEPLFGALDSDHWHRRFRRDPFDLAEPVLVQHHVADDEHRIGSKRGPRHKLACG